MADEVTVVARPHAPALQARYELLVTIATGGMATVYVGRQHGAAGFQRIVAVKRMHPHIATNPDLAAMFRDEARIASLIQHPNVVAIHDVHLEAGETLLIMDYVDGVSLGQLRKHMKSREVALPRKVALRIVHDALRGLHAAHEQKDIEGAPLCVVHRDATPHNILLAADGTVRVTDFGIAHAAQRSAETVTGQVKGKFAYMAPEQCAGGEIDRRVDVFAVGVVLWELLTGHHLFKADNDAVILNQIVAGKYRRPSEVKKDIAKRLDAITMKAIAQDAKDRFATAAEFADVIESFARSHGGLATAAEVAEVVTAACGELIQARRHQLHEVLGGRAPKVVWSAPHGLTAGKGSQSYNPSPSVLTVDGRSGHASTEPTGTGVAATHEQPSRRWMLIAGAGAAAALLVVIAALALRGSSSTSASGTSSDPSGAAAASGSAVAGLGGGGSGADGASGDGAIARVTVRIEADDEIVEIRVPDGSDVELDGPTATFTTPQGETPVSVHIRLADGSEMDDAVKPTANAVIRVRKIAGGAPKRRGPPGAPAGQPPGTATATATATRAPPGLRYENDPYQ
jgi:serine/threonine-protein kinase